jgi:hypothetical protein
LLGGVLEDRSIARASALPLFAIKADRCAYPVNYRGGSWALEANLAAGRTFLVMHTLPISLMLMICFAMGYLIVTFVILP